MPKIEEQYIVNICKPTYNIVVEDPYASSCAKQVPGKFPEPELLSNLEYSRAKAKAIADIDREFVSPSTTEVDNEKKYEGYIVAWLLQRETGWENKLLFGKSPRRIIDEALDFFVKPYDVGRMSRTKIKRRYWQIRIPLILIENINAQKIQSLFKRHERFFELGPIDFSQPRKKVIFDILQKLKDKVEKKYKDPAFSIYKDPALLSEIYFKIGILQNEKAKYEGAQGSKAYFKKAAEQAQKILKDPAHYKSRYIQNRVENVVVKSTRTTMTNYYQAQEMYRALSGAHKMLAQTTLLMPRSEEIPISKLKEALEHVRKAESYIIHHPTRKEYINLEWRNYPKGSIYKYFGDVYSVLDLERLRTDILSRQGLIFKEPCPAESARYINEAQQLLDKIIRWKDDFVKNRKDCVFNKYMFKKLRNRVAKKDLEACLTEEWKLHPLVEEKGIALISEWGADIIGNVYLAKARLLMSVYPPPHDPKANLRKAKALLTEAKKCLVKKDDYNFLSAWAEYLTRMHIEASPKTLMPEIQKAKEILEAAPEGFLFSQIWLARIYIKEEKFEQAQKFLEDILSNPKFKTILIPQLKSSIHQTLAELALEDENLLKAEKLFTRSICWYPYNFYTQIGLADLANWSGRYEDTLDSEGHRILGAISLYQRVLKDPRIPINVRKRIGLGLAEVALRRKGLDPGIDPTREADQVIARSLKILEESDELFMLERAMQSMTEALINKKHGGQAALEDIRDNLLKTDFDFEKYLSRVEVEKYLDNPLALGKETTLKNPEIRDRIKAGLYLKIADGLLFIHKYKEAEELLKGFETNFSKVFEKKPVIKAHYLLTSAEITQRQNQYDEAAIRKIEESAKIIFSLKEEKRDPFLSARAIKDLIDIYVNKDDFESALALVFAAQGLDAKTELKKLEGILDSDRFETAQQNVAEILQGLDVKKIFENKGLVHAETFDRWDLFSIELQLKQAEISTWTKNYQPAFEILKRLTSTDISRNLKDIHQARIQLVHGNIASQWKGNQDYRKALNHYKEAEKIVEGKLDDPNPGQELILIRSELYINLANIFRYGRNGGVIIDSTKSFEYYKKGEEAVTGTTRIPGIRGNDDLKYYHLARIYLGRAQLHQQKSNPTPTWGNLATARGHFDQIVRKYKIANKELKLELERMKQDVHVPNIDLSYEHISNKQRSSENRVSTTIAVPFLRDQYTLYFSNITDTHHDPDYGRSIINASYVGFKVKPEWLFGKRLTLDFKYKIPAPVSGILSEDKEAPLPLNFRRPDIALGATFWWKYFTAAFAYEKSFDEKRLDTFYANAMFNLAWTENPYLQMQFGPVVSSYHFVFLSDDPQVDYRKRLFAGIGLNYTLDLADIFKSLDYNFLKVDVNATIPIWEYEREAKHGYMEHDREEDRSIFNLFNTNTSGPWCGPVPWQAKVGLQINLGKFGKIQASLGGSYQKTSRYEDYSWGVGASYRLNFFNLSEIFDEK